jgi:hypothetical protein
VKEPIQARIAKLLKVYERPQDPDAQVARWALKQLQQAQTALRLLELGSQNASTVDAPWVEEIALRGLVDTEEMT